MFFNLNFKIMKYIILLLSLILPFNLISQVTFTDVAPALGVNDAGAGQGVVFLDINNDGYLDIFNVNNNTTIRLWMNNGGTSFTDVSTAWGITGTYATRGIAAADFDNDGNIDVMVGNYNQTLLLYKNTGTAFTNFTTNAGVNFTGWGGSINWIDFNMDGKVDAIYGNDGVPYHYNYMFRNDNGTSFTNVAYSIGLVDSMSTLCIGSADYDNDGDMDLFLGSQTAGTPGTGILYRNNGNGTFTDVTSASQLITMSYTWGCDWGDFDNDGDMDLYLGHSNGPNQLFQNNGSGTFTDVSMTYGVNDPTSTYSCGWADYDNDGDLDLYVANGSTGIDKLYRNDGSTFTDVAASVGTNDSRHSACISWGDYNNDGFMDLYLVNNGTENRLYKSNAGNSNKWVEFRLRGVTSNRSAIGARVTVKAGSLTMIREVQGGSGGKGMNSLPVEFGLGSASNIDSLIIRWPNGTYFRTANVVVNRIYDVVEGQGIVGGIIGINPVAFEYRLNQNFPNPFNPETSIWYQLENAGYVHLEVFDVRGNQIIDRVDGQHSKGPHNVSFNGGNLPSGVYFYKLTVRQAGSSTGNFVETKKMILVK